MFAFSGEIKLQIWCQVLNIVMLCFCIWLSEKQMHKKLKNVRVLGNSVQHWTHVFTFHFGLCNRQSPQSQHDYLPQVIMLVEEWIDTYSIHHWRIFRSSYRKLAWVEFEPTTTEFLSDALTDWAIRPWVQLALRANYIYKFTCGCHSQTTPSLKWR